MVASGGVYAAFLGTSDSSSDSDMDSNEPLNTTSFDFLSVVHMHTST